MLAVSAVIKILIVAVVLAIVSFSVIYLVAYLTCKKAPEVTVVNMPGVLGISLSLTSMLLVLWFVLHLVGVNLF